MCEIFAIFGQAQAARFASEGLFAQQHRGQDACGIAVSDGTEIRRHRGVGLVREVLSDSVLLGLTGDAALGHVRYPTQGPSTLENAQPHLFSFGGRTHFALASNGDITNLPEFGDLLRRRGIGLDGCNDAEVIAKCVGVWAYGDGLGLEAAIARWMREARGAYSTVLLGPEGLWVFRDPNGLRPLALGEIERSIVAASETVALDILRARFIREVEPGEILRVDASGSASVRGVAGVAKRHCIFEHIYFSRPDSAVFGEKVFEVRKRIGEALAEGDCVEADVVIPIPDSANFIGFAYAAARGIPAALGLVRNHYVGRTFIAPEQITRDEGVRLKFNPLPGFLEGKRVVLVDDSIVRGTTIRKLIRMLRENGAREVHLRIGSPPIRHSCFYGIDTPEESKLIASGRGETEVGRLLEADSLRYLPLEGLRSTVSKPEDYCYACFDGNYPAGRKPSGSAPD
jgi:amidophosphoribosyltransferase